MRIWRWFLGPLLKLTAEMDWNDDGVEEAKNRRHIGWTNSIANWHEMRNQMGNSWPLEPATDGHPSTTGQLAHQLRPWRYFWMQQRRSTSAKSNGSWRCWWNATLSQHSITSQQLVEQIHHLFLLGELLVLEHGPDGPFSAFLFHRFGAVSVLWPPLARFLICFSSWR